MAMMTVDDVIDALGGTLAVAELFGVGRTAVVNWRTFGKFPARLHYRLAKVCAERGVALDERLLDGSWVA